MEYFLFDDSYAAQDYIANRKTIDNTLLVYDWFKEFIVAITIQNKLPPEYISRLHSIASIDDNVEERITKNYFIRSGC